MKDYSAMSDFEINCHVAEKAGIGDSMFLSSDESELAEEDPKKRGPIWNVPSWIQVKSWMPSKGNCFNPCNNPADAWPIIVADKITLLWIEKTSIWCAAIGGLVEHDYWGWEECPEMYSENINPLRAAMIVYLQMMEQKS